MATLYDHLGRPVEAPRRPEKAQLAIHTIRDRWSTYPSNGLTPERLASVLREADEGYSATQAELFEEMEERDGHLFSVCQTRRNAVVGLPWRVLPASDETPDQEAADLVDEVLRGLDVEDLFLSLLDAIGKGFAVSEILWEVVGDRVLPRSIEWVHPKRFRWGDHGELRLLTDDSPTLGERLPAHKFIVHLYRARSGWPSRAGVLRVCAWAYLFKNYAVKDWVAFAEVYGMPLRLGFYDPSATKEDKEALALALQMLGSDASGMVSTATKIDFVESKVNKGADVYATLSAWCDATMSKAVLGQTLTTEVGDTGSYAASKTHADVRQDLLEGDALALAKTLQRDLFRPLVGFNLGWDRTASLPKLDLDARQPEDLKPLAETYGTLVQQVGLPIGLAHIYERFGIPEPEESEATVGGRPAGDAGAAGGGAPPLGLRHGAVDQPGVRRLALSDGGRETQAGLDRLAASAAGEAQGAVEKLFATLVARVEAAADLEALKTELLAEYSALDAGGLEDVLARALHVAGLAGRVSHG